MRSRFTSTSVLLASFNSFGTSASRFVSFQNLDSGSGRKGRAGKDTFIVVPCGTLVSEVIKVRPLRNWKASAGTVAISKI